MQAFISKLFVFVAMYLTIDSGSAAADYTKTDCLGPVDAQRRFVFLHGWENPNHPDQEYRNELESLSKQHGWRVALPRGRGRCAEGNSRQCWAIKSVEELRQSWQIVQEGAEECFGKGKDWGIVGFSNGGYFAASLFSLCWEPRPLWIMGFGSAGTRSNVSKPTGCGSFALVIGKNDPTFPAAKAFGQSLIKNNKNIIYREFDGGHRVDYPSLPDLIKQLEAMPPN